MPPRSRLTAADARAVQMYADSARSVVQGMTEGLDELFRELLGDGAAARKRMETLLSLWREQAGRPTPARLREEVHKLGATPSREDLIELLNKGMEMAPAAAARTADAYLANRVTGTPDRALDGLIDEVFAEARSLFCLQSAYVTLARIVTFRVLEDQAIVSPPRVSGDAIARTAAIPAGAPLASPHPWIELVDRASQDGERLLPQVFEKREFDWWTLPETVLVDGRRRKVSASRRTVDGSIRRMLEEMDRYDFAAVDHDVWRDVYQHQLPREERLRLGGFYTPDRLVYCALDQAGWSGRAAAEGVLLDPSSGSGAFPVEAVRRRREALEVAGKLRPGRLTPKELDELVHGVAAFDVHPFATFLTATNILFQVIDLYLDVRKRHNSYRMRLDVFTVDSLETSGFSGRQSQLLKRLPAELRLHHTKADQKRFRELLDARFTAVAGNPPWGGVLKGRLSPLNSPEQKRRYSDAYSSATGKYDIYVLFIERALDLLRDGGRYGLVVPNSFFEKGFGQGVRGELADRGYPEVILDLRKFGQLFFNAQNTPCIIGGQRSSAAHDVHCAVWNDSPSWATTDRSARIDYVMDATISGIAAKASSDPALAIFDIPSSASGDWGRPPWHIDPLASHRPTLEAAARPVGKLVDAAQGFTPGGEGASALYLIERGSSVASALAGPLLLDHVTGTAIQAWARPVATGHALYPYAKGIRRGAEVWGPAFDDPIGGDDPADLLAPLPLTSSEAAVLSGVAAAEVPRTLISHRVAAGRIGPQLAGVAKYLDSHRELLSSRVAKGKPYSEFGRRWYEMLWPRDPKIIAAPMKIVSPRYVRWPRFAIDDSGLVIHDNALAISPSSDPLKATWFRELAGELEASLGAPPTRRQLLQWLLAALNSVVGAFQLRVGMTETAQGSFTAKPDFLDSVPHLPPSTSAVSDILSVVERLEAGATGAARTSLLDQLDDLVMDGLNLDKDLQVTLRQWRDDTRPADA